MKASLQGWWVGLLLAVSVPLACAQPAEVADP